MAIRYRCVKCGREVDKVYNGDVCKTCHKDNINSFVESYIAECYNQKEGEKRMTIFQAYLYHRLKKVSDSHNMISFTELRKIFCSNSNMPLPLHRTLLRELQGLKLVKQEGRKGIKILKG